MRMLSVPASSMCILFDTRVELERVPEPFRLQDDLALSIPYSEYLMFAHSLSYDSLIDMYPSTKEVLEQLQAQSIRNYRSYLLNVAFALLKELHFSAEYNLAPTIYLPASENGNTVPWRLYVEQCKRLWADDTVTWDLCEDYGLDYRPVCQDAVRLWRLSTCLLKVSQTVSAEGVLNLTP